MSGYVDDTIAAIDSAISDFAVSKDAMRCRPPARRGRIFVAPAGTAPAPNLGQGWQEIGYAAEGVTWSAHDLETFARAWQDVRVVIRVRMTEVASAFKTMVGALAASLDGGHAAMASVLYADDYASHRRRCRLCNPEGNPKPLKVNGHEYARRRRARRRRRA